jgi:hypothetical protein
MRMGRGSRGGKTVEGGSAVDASVFAAHGVSSAGAGHGGRSSSSGSSEQQDKGQGRAGQGADGGTNLSGPGGVVG